MQNAESAAEQCRAILARFLPIQDFRVALLVGDGYRHMFEADEELLRLAIADLSLGAA